LVSKGRDRGYDARSFFFGKNAWCQARFQGDDFTALDRANPSVEAMGYRLATPEGKRLYGLRKHTPEPVFGIIKSVLGFRQFLLRGLDKVRGEWSLVTMARNLKRMFALNAAG
jgi:hypothetical protein